MAWRPAVTFDEVNALLSPRGPIISVMDDEERRVLWRVAESTPGPVIEVGCQYGGTTILLALATRSPVYVVDNWACGQRDDWIANCCMAGVNANTFEVAGDSVDKADSFPDAATALVLVDGDHTGEKPYLDLMAYAPKVALGGFLFVDDVGWGHPDALAGVARFENAIPSTSFIRVFHHKQVTGESKLLGYRRVEW